MPMERITREDLAVAMEDGALRFDVDDEYLDAVYTIGESLPLYFAGTEAEGRGHDYLNETPTDILLDEVFETIDHMERDPRTNNPKDFYAECHAYYALGIQRCYLWRAKAQDRIASDLTDIRRHIVDVSELAQGGAPDTLDVLTREAEARRDGLLQLATRFNDEIREVLGEEELLVDDPPEEPSRQTGELEK